MSRNQALLAWYKEHGRHLPWRGWSDPWVILVSEVICQQTPVAYSGSLRQTRAAVIKELSRQPQSTTTALGAVLATPLLEEAIVSLVDEGMIAGPEGWASR